jgi:hypothetical protein
MESDQSATRAARRFLEDRVRNDWEWPKAPPCWSASDEEVRDATAFRERYYDTSDSASSAEDDATDVSQGPYKFDTPDSIQSLVEKKAERRKARKRAALEAEMEENEGLNIFVKRRDCWTGAEAVRKYGTDRSTASGNGKTPPATTVIADGPTSRPASIEASSSDTSTPMELDTPQPPASPSSASSEPPPATNTNTNTTEPLIPLAAPLLPENSIRQSITPKTYPDIYSKIVLQSRTPSVPINLGDMTKALVLGWQSNGEWPPKAAPLDPLAGRKRAMAGIALANRTDNGAEPFFAHHPHLQKGVEGMKKMLHLGGGNQHEGGGAGAAGPGTGAGNAG